ncbi:PREDICTED: serine/arginine repetitive matrix protein 1-like isoform X2 [Dinoponera quadriceps]|uniref:Serine/arginine repetitive matrix protein 1-like isoform X2 n=1 Tax=Dinoponera quadriceps TaxID=609295 RepID=A0A6P3X9Q3_DINQU|nr:PREDICTED: serine/arginine repetitive matrix protein 1-like isoform X2 [Dinoponera quadriceps]
MEIPKAMQEEINSTQNKLGKAILEHQKCMGMLKEDPNNSDIRKQKEQIQLHILSLGKIQKQIVERLRKTVQNDAADNANGSKVSIKFPSLWGLNNNNHITNNNETKHETVANGFETKPSKEDYEEVVANGDVPSPLQHNNCTKRSPNLVVTVSGEDDIVEVPMDENSNKKQDEMEEENEEKVKEKLKKILLSYLELMTTQEALELQNKKAERKRRSTANPQFVYSMMEQPAKRQKRVSYLQSGNAPHTRQTTARMNGPSPPPSSKAQATKSTSLQARANTKSLIPVQKSSTRPNILRNADSKVFASKNKVDDKQTQSSVTSAKTVQIGGKTVHLPALPSSLTIERIDNDSVLSPVCLSCRNKTPGPLTVCEICSWSYHVTCHTMPAPPNTCPKCTMVMELKKNVQKEEEAEGGERMDGEKPLEGDKLEEKERERYELRERNSDLRLQVYELEKRSQLLGQSLQLQQRLRQELLGKQEKTQRSIKRLVDFIKLMQVRKSESSPPPSASISSPPRPSLSQSPPTTARTSSNPRTGSLAQPPITSNDKTSSQHVTPSFSASLSDRALPTSKPRNKCPTPTSCQTPSLKSTNHTSSSKKSPSQVEGPISLLAIKPTTKAILQLSTINCRPRPAAALPSRPASSSPTPCSSAVTTVRGRPPAQSQHSTALSARKGFSPSARATISWSERPTTAGSPGPSSRAINSASVSSQPADPLQKLYSHPTATASSRVASTSTLKSQGPPSADQQRRARASIAVLGSTGRQEPSSTHCSQAITGPISSPIVRASHEVSAQTSETAHSCGNSSAVWSSWSSRASQAAQQQQSSSSGAPSRGSSST